MHEAIAKQWITALRSGKYSQAKKALHIPDGFCCLGVLCDLKGVEWEFEQDEKKFYALGADGVLPKAVREWAGMSTDSGLIPSREIEGRDYQLSAINDSGRTFDQIADTIEKHWYEL